MAAGVLIFDLLAKDHASPVFKHVGREAHKLENQFHQLGHNGSGSMSKLASISKTALLGFSGVAAASGVTLVKMAANYQESLTTLVTGAGESESNIKLVGDGMLAMAGKVGVSADQLSKGMYLIESSGKHGADGLKVLQAAAEGARVGAADMTTVADGLTTALNDYKIPASQATLVTSKLVATVAAGKTRMGDLAGALATVLPAASTAKLGLDQVLGALATMTAAGTPAAAAATALKQTIAQLVNPTAKAQAEMKALGLSSIDISKNLGKRGLTGTLQILTDAIEKHMGPAGTVLIQSLQKSAKSTTDFQKILADLPPVQQTYISALANMVGGTKSMQAALELTGANAKTFNDNVKTISGTVNDAGGHVKGFALTQQDFNTKLANLEQTVHSLAIEWGTKLLPVATKMVQKLSDGLQPGGKLRDVLSGLGGAAKTFGQDVQPVFGWIGDHPDLFKEIAKDAGILLGVLKAKAFLTGLGLLKSASGAHIGTGSVGAAATLAKPLPVFVTNEGFGIPGGKGTGGAPTVIGKGGSVAASEGRFSKILASNLTATAILMGDVVLGSKAESSLKTVFNLHFDLSVKGAAEKFIKQLDDPSLDKVTKSILSKHSAAVLSGLATAASTGSTKELQKALNDTYADVSKHAAQIQAEIKRQAAVDATNNAKLIAGGLAPAVDQVQRTSRQMVSELSTGLGGGLGRAKERANDLSDALKQFPTLKIDTGHAAANVSSLTDKYKYLLNLPGHKTLTVTANLLTKGQHLSLGTVRTSGNELYIQTTKGKLELADGGYVRGRGGPRSDLIPAMLSNGEFVMNAKAAQRYAPQLEAMNAGRAVASSVVHNHYTTVHNSGNRELTAREIIQAERMRVWLDGS